MMKDKIYRGYGYKGRVWAIYTPLARRDIRPDSIIVVKNSSGEVEEIFAEQIKIDGKG